MAKPKALAMPSRLTAVGPVPIPPTTAAPQPKNTRAKVPMNSASCLFIVLPHNSRPSRRNIAAFIDVGARGLAAGGRGRKKFSTDFIRESGVAFARRADIYATLLV